MKRPHLFFLLALLSAAADRKEEKFPRPTWRGFFGFARASLDFRAHVWTGFFFVLLKIFGDWVLHSGTFVCVQIS